MYFFETLYWSAILYEGHDPEVYRREASFVFLNESWQHKCRHFHVRAACTLLHDSFPSCFVEVFVFCASLCTCMLSSASSTSPPLCSSLLSSPLLCRLCQLLGFPSYKPPCPAGSDGRAPPDSIALIPSSFAPRIPSSAPSRGHGVHGRQGSAAEGTGLCARGYRWQVHPAEVHHQGAGLPTGLRRVGLRPGRQAAATVALKSRPWEVRRQEREAEGGLLPLL